MQTILINKMPDFIFFYLNKIIIFVLLIYELLYFV